MINISCISSSKIKNWRFQKANITLSHEKIELEFVQCSIFYHQSNPGREVQELTEVSIVQFRIQALELQYPENTQSAQLQYLEQPGTEMKPKKKKKIETT